MEPQQPVVPGTTKMRRVWIYVLAVAGAVVVGAILSIVLAWNILLSRIDADVATFTGPYDVVTVPDAEVSPFSVSPDSKWAVKVTKVSRGPITSWEAAVKSTRNDADWVALTTHSSLRWRNEDPQVEWIDNETVRVGSREFDVSSSFRQLQ